MEHERNTGQIAEKRSYIANAMHYISLTEVTNTFEERAELYKKAAEELKKTEYKDYAHKLMAKHYFFLSLSTENKSESERYQLLASGETKLGWLYITRIAFNESRKSRTIDASFLELTIELYKKHLKHKNRQFPVYSVYICGDTTGPTCQIMAEMSDYFKLNTTSFPRGKFKNTPKFKEEVKKNDFVLMELIEDIDDELLYELGLVAGMGKPIIVLISGNINSFNKFIPKVATITADQGVAFTALKIFSVIKSGESLTVEDKHFNIMNKIIKKRSCT